MLVWTDLKPLIFVWTLFLLLEALLHALPTGLAIALLVIMAAVYLYVPIRRRFVRRKPAENTALARRMAAICAGSSLTPAVVLAPVPFLNVKEGRVEVSPQMGEIMTDAELKALITHSQSGSTNWREWPVRVVGPGMWLLIGGAVLSLLTGKPWASVIFPFASLLGTGLDRLLPLQTWVARPEAARFMQAGGDPVALASALRKLYDQGGPFANMATVLRGRIEALRGLAPEQSDRLAVIRANLVEPHTRVPQVHAIAWYFYGGIIAVIEVILLVVIF